MGGGIVNVHGQRVADLQVKGSSLVKGQQWIDYLDAYAGLFRDEQPWARFLLNATASFHQGFIIMSRRLRKNREFAGVGTMAEETAGLLSDAAERLAWFENHSQEIDERGLPDWARFLFASLQGGLRMQVRLATEAEQILRKGHLLLAVDRQGTLVETLNEEHPDNAGAERE